MKTIGVIDRKFALLKDFRGACIVFFRLVRNNLGHRKFHDERIHGDVRSCGADVLKHRLALGVVIKAEDHLLTRAELQIAFQARVFVETLRKRRLHGSAAVGWIGRIVRSNAPVGIFDQCCGGLGVVHLFVVCKSYLFSDTNEKNTLCKKKISRTSGNI